MAKRQLKVQQDQYLDLFYAVIEDLQRLPAKQWPALADKADISLGTLYKWINYEIYCPHFRTVYNVAWALGYEITKKKRNVTFNKPKLVAVK